MSGLSAARKDQLALLPTQRKVLVFRDQDFADLSIQKALEYGAYFGRHQINPTSGSPEGHPEIHPVHRRAADKGAQDLLSKRASTIAWQSDVTYEEQPPGNTFLYVLDVPETGGDTLFADMVEAYNRLSPAFQERLHGLKTVHSGTDQADFSKKRGSTHQKRAGGERPSFSMHTSQHRRENALYKRSMYANHYLC